MKIKRNVTIFFLLLGILFLIIGAQWDLMISNALYDPKNLFGRFLQDGFPLLLELWLACCFLVMNDRKHWYWLIGTLLSLMLLVKDSICALPIGSWCWVWLFASILTVLMLRVLYKWLTPWQKQFLRSWIIFFLQVFFTTICIVFIMKMIWGRIRFRDLQDATSFCVWYRPCLQGGTSFPSGHTSTFAACLLPLLSVPQIKRKRMAAVLISILIILMMISRIMMGAHYLSDTAAGMLIALGCWNFYDHRWERWFHEHA